MAISEKTLHRQNMMLTQPLPKVILQMAYPTIISFLISQIYSLADTFFVSSLGTNAAAAVSVNSSLDQIIMMAGSMLAIGATSYVSRLLGSGNQERASKVLSTAFFTAVAFGLVVAILGFAFMKPMVRLLGATPTCEQYSIDYATYVLLAAPFMAANFVMNQCLRGEGSALLSMIGMGIGGVINCVLDPIFILDWGLGLGVAGASIATAISKLISFAILIYPYLRKRTVLRLSIRLFAPDRDIFSKIVSVGSSSLFRNGLAVVAAIALNNIAGGISDSVLAGVGITNKVMMFPFAIILGFSSGFQPVAGFNWGAKRYDRVRESYRFASRVALLAAAAMGVLMFVFAGDLIGIFTETDADMMRFGMLCIRLQAIALPIHSWVAVVNGMCAGLGYAGFAVALSTSRQGSCFLPILPIMAFLAGENGIAAVQATADILSMFIAIPIIRTVHRRIDEAEGRLSACEGAAGDDEADDEVPEIAAGA